MTSHWSRLYFMTFYIVTMVRAAQSRSAAQFRRLMCALTLNSPDVPALSPGGDDHHCGVHSGCVCVPHELQPQESGTTGEPRGWDRIHFITPVVGT